MRTLLPLVTLAGCLGTSTTGVAPPPGGLSLAWPPHAARGGTTVLEITGALPGETLYVLGSRSGVGAGECLSTLGGACLGIRPTAALVRAVAATSGTTRVPIQIPTTRVGSIGLQAVVRRGPRGSASLLSNAVLLDVYPPADTADPECPLGTALLADLGVCIDRWEAHLTGASPYETPAGGVAASAPGVVPQAYLSAVHAADACAAAGKRLCTRPEWERACRGPGGTTYPYGNTFDAAACNTSRSLHPVLEVFGAGATFTFAQLNDPRLNQLADGLALTGGHPGCVTPEGVFDLHGNLHEWVDDAAGTFKGGFYVDASLNGVGCGYTTTAHDLAYHDYSTGFRCCRDVTP